MLSHLILRYFRPRSAGLRGIRLGQGLLALPLEAPARFVQRACQVFDPTGAGPRGGGADGGAGGGPAVSPA